MTSGWDGRWHPDAIAYAMYDEDQLRSLAESIAANGQRFPCVMTPDGLGLDGRNRVAACELAGIEPRWEIHDGDPVAFIVDANAERRPWSTGQKAMAKARRLVETGQRENGKFRHGSVTSDDRSWSSRVAQAGLVLDHAPDLATDVLRGTTKLDAAYRTAVENRDRARRLAELDPELAALVESSVVDLAEAEHRADVARRTRDLDADLQRRVHDDGMSIGEAERVMGDRLDRLNAWVIQIQNSLESLNGMAGYPIPDGITSRLTKEQAGDLRRVLAALSEEC